MLHRGRRVFQRELENVRMRRRIELSTRTNSSPAQPITVGSLLQQLRGVFTAIHVAQ